MNPRKRKDVGRAWYVYAKKEGGSMQGEIFHTTLPSPLLVLPPLLRLFFRVPGVIITPLFFAFSRLFSFTFVSRFGF